MARDLTGPKVVLRLAMRIVLVCIVTLAACGGPPKKQSAIVNEGFDVPATCCCKTTPVTAEAEIVPVFAMEGRMDCSAQKGDCVDDVQCNGVATPAADTGVPPPPRLTPAN